MDIDQSLLNHPANGTMQLPAGVVANAPYQGSAPMFPNIPVSLISPYTNPRSARSLAGSHQQTLDGASQVWYKVADIGPGHAVSAQWAIRPSMRNAAVLGFTEAQLHQITGGYGRRESMNQNNNWMYEMRRDAQQVLPHLYLGPSNAARDRAFLRRAGITKVMAIRDSRLAEARLLVVEHVAKELGIESECVDVADTSALLRALTAAVQSINRHMLAMPTDADGVSTGKVLVYCETGNVRSPPVVAAYLMSMYGKELLDTLRFVHKARFCISLDEEYKHMLQSFSDLLSAQRDVAAEEDDIMQDDAYDSGPKLDSSTRKGVENLRLGLPHGHPDARPGLLAVVQQGGSSKSRSRPPKRHVEETMDEEDDRAEGASEYVQSREPSAEPGWLNLDMARYQDRAQFAPFSDRGAK
ncbi:hypothetical protein SCUCBS95973_006383 [Sporothrix curviconia]|uniref:Tyrosine specific protein phosphatases domain-containing protein n=1 Tax=Sporothrix curviconia TaxID=1260050 RepID=A0ABP0C6Z8_9PEZI